MMTKMLLVFFGGGLGSLCRYLLVSSFLVANFPFSTVVVNLLGCFVMGLLFPLLSQNNIFHPLILVGFLGGFTTFSAFARDVNFLCEHDSFIYATLYIGLSLFGSLLFYFFGQKLIKIFF